MNVQEQIKEWYQDRRFVNYVNMRVQEEIRHVSEQRPDQKYKELDDAFDLDDRYFVPLTTYLTYRLQLAKLQKNRSKRRRGIWWDFIRKSPPRSLRNSKRSHTEQSYRCCTMNM